MKRVVLIFPGQGSQYVGMAKSLCGSFREAKEAFQEAGDTLGFDIEKLCNEGSMEELTRTENTQPAVLTASVAAYRVYMKEIGIEPVYAAGHSLGEISALCCAGGIRFSDAVSIVRQRGMFMQEAVPVGVGGMAAISGAGQDAIEAECRKASVNGKLAAISNYNSPEQIVISGNIEAVNEAGNRLKAAGARVIPLKVSAPFHTPLMRPAADKLGKVLEQYSYGELRYKVISNVTAQPYPGRESIIEYLTGQMIRPVRWQSSMEFVWKHGVDLAVELGPQTVLKNLMKKNVPGLMTCSIGQEPDIQALKNQLALSGQEAGNGIDFITRCIAIAVCTKNSNWDEQEYQRGVVEPYREVKSMKEKIMKEGRNPSPEEIRKSLDMLKSVFITKKSPVEEQAERFNELFEKTGTRHLFPDFKMPL